MSVHQLSFSERPPKMQVRQALLITSAWIAGVTWLFTTPAIGQIYDRLHRWRFDMQRLHALGACPPDPSVQKTVLTHFATKLSEADAEFE